MLDLNCDLGEGESPAVTRRLMRWITSANIACGGHAGDAGTMAACMEFALEYRVLVGAHPGLPDRSHFGRRSRAITPPELESILLQQVSALETVARSHRLGVHHIKLHGALYHAAETSPDLALAYVKSVRRWWPRARIYALAGGQVARTARGQGLRVWEEIFVDRAYAKSGSLVPRTRPGAVLATTRPVMDRLSEWRRTAQWRTVSGGSLPLRADTLCVHSDSPRAQSLVKTISKWLAEPA